MLIQSKPSYDSWSYRLLFVSFFMPMHLQTLVLLSLSGFWILSFQPIPAKIQRSDWGLLLLMAVSFLLYVIYIPVTEPTLRDGLYCMLERKVSLLLLPVLMLLISRRSGASVLRELPWFVYANLLSGLLVNGLLLFKYLRFDRLGSVNHVAYRMDFEQWMNIHPSYYGLFCCWSLCILLFHPAAIFRRIRIGSQALLLLFLLLLAPKTSLLTAVLIYLFTLWFYRRRLGWKMQVSLFLTSILAAGLSYLCLPFFQQRINEVLSFAGLMQTPGMSNSMDYRSLIIDIDLRLLREHWLFGLGPIGLQQQLDLAFWHASVLTGIPLGTYNTHNEFLNQWLSFGLAGGMLFVLTMVYFLITAYRAKNMLYGMWLMVVLMACLTENILSRQHGILLFTVFLPLGHFISSGAIMRSGEQLQQPDGAT